MSRYLVLIAALTMMMSFEAQAQGLRQFPDRPPPSRQQPGIDRLQVRDVFISGTGLVQLVVRGNTVETGQFIPISDMSEAEILGSQFAADGGIPDTRVIINNDDIIVLQLTFPDGSVVFVVIHKATGTMTTIDDPEGP